MAIKIAHFAIDENGRAIGGAAGDQHGKECCVIDWYNKPWDYYIEITDEALANKAADLFTKVANGSAAGYDQGQRLTFYDELVACKGDVSKMKKCEADCSSGVASIYKFLGLNISHACTTRNIRAALVKTGKVKVYSDKDHVASDKYAKRGGLYLKEGSHVVMAVENGSAVTKPNKPSTSNTVIGTAVANETMTVRDESNKSGKALGYVNKGKSVEVLEILSNGWYKIVWKKASCGYAYTSNAGGGYYTYTDKSKTDATTSTTTKKKFISGGIDYSLVFNPTYYVNKYADLKKAFGTNEDKLFNHFLQYGMKEARQAIEDFNVNIYKSRYADLQKAFGNNMPDYYKHYIKYGYKERRKAI